MIITIEMIEHWSGRIDSNWRSEHPVHSLQDRAQNQNHKRVQKHKDSQSGHDPTSVPNTSLSSTSIVLCLDLAELEMPLCYRAMTLLAAQPSDTRILKRGLPSETFDS